MQLVQHTSSGAISSIWWYLKTAHIVCECVSNVWTGQVTVDREVLKAGVEISSFLWIWNYWHALSSASLLWLPLYPLNCFYSSKWHGWNLVLSELPLLIICRMIDSGQAFSCDRGLMCSGALEDAANKSMGILLQRTPVDPGDPNPSSAHRDTHH